MIAAKIVLAVCIGCLLFVSYVYFSARAPGTEGISVDDYTSLDVLRQAQTGDLIFLSGDSLNERFIRWVTGGAYSHVGILVRELDNTTGLEEVYVWEADLGQKHRSGPRSILLRDKLAHYKGLRVGGWRRCVSELNTEDVMNVVNKYINCEMDMVMTSWIFSYRPKSPGDSLPKVFCSELVALTLQDLNVIPSDRRAVTFSPKDLEDIEGYELLQNFVF